MLRLFKHHPKKMQALSPTDVSKVAEQLTRIRCQNYVPITFATLNDDDFSAIKHIAIVCGDKIFAAKNKHKPQGFIASVLKSYHSIIEQLYHASNPSPFIFFAAQLVQYHTVIWRKEPLADWDFNAFDLFLNQNLKQFGATCNNVLIIEHKIIKMHNDILKMVDRLAFELEQNFEEFELAKEHFKRTQTKLQALHQSIDELLLAQHFSDEDVFYHYLKLMAHYVSTVVLEIRITLQTPCCDNMQTMEHMKKHLIQEINRHYLKIKQCDEQAQQDHILPLGMQFSLGEDIYSKMPPLAAYLDYLQYRHQPAFGVL